MQYSMEKQLSLALFTINFFVQSFARLAVMQQVRVFLVFLQTFRVRGKELYVDASVDIVCPEKKLLLCKLLLAWVF